MVGIYLDQGILMYLASYTLVLCDLGKEAIGIVGISTTSKMILYKDDAY